MSTKKRQRTIGHKQNRATPKEYKPRKLDELDYEIIRLVLGSPGITHDRIAKRFGYRRPAITRRMHNPLFMSRISDLQTAFTKDAIDLIRQHQAPAIQTIANIMQNGMEVNKLRAAMWMGKGLSDIAANTLKPEHGESENISADDLESLVLFAEEVKKRKAADNG